MRGITLVILALLLWEAGARGEEANTLFGRPIVSVAFTSDGRVDAEMIGRLVELKAGEPLTDTATGATVRNLYATGDFREILIEGVPREEGVAVTVHLFRSFRVHPIKFDDGVSLSKEEMRRAIPFSEGSVFSPEALEEGAEALKRRAAAEGHIQAEVFPEVAFDHEKFQAHVVYRIEAGEAARVAKALFDGETAPFTADQLLRKARLDPGDRYRESRAIKDAERMTEVLHDAGRLEGIVELIVAQPTEDGRVMPVYRISVGPEVVFETRGVREKKVRREIHDAIEGQGFSEDFVLQYVENKKLDLQRKGYYRARVDYSVAEAPGKTTVTITLEEGEKYAIEEIRIVGNESVEQETLRDLLVTQEKGLPLIRPGRLVEKVLEEDASAILGYYQTHGWVNATVEEPQVTAGSEPRRLIVSITVKEGPRTIVASRKVVGAEHADSEEIEKLFQVKPGEPFNPNEVRYDAYALQSYYLDRGWREATVDDEWTLSADKASAEVVYRVEEGMRSFFGKTIVRGNTVTHTGRILKIVTWDEGDAFSEGEVLKTQRNLTRTGVFQRVEIQPQAADPASPARNIEIEVREGRAHSLLYGLGYQYAPEAAENRNDPYLVFGATHNNLFGSMRSAGLDLQLRQSALEDLSRGRGRAQISFRDPFLLGKDIPLTAFLFASREPIQEIDIERLGFITEISRYYGRYLRAGLRYEYQRIRPVNEEDLTVIGRDFSRFDQEIEQSTVGPNAFYDRRDDIIDPHEGYYISTSAKYAFPFVTAEARYTKVSGQAVFFQPVSRSVLAVSVRAGGIYPYGAGDVPIAERFFGGGPSTNRGFDTDLLGVLEDPPEGGDGDRRTVDYDTRAFRRPDGEQGSCFQRYPQREDVENFDCDFGPRIVGGNGFFAFNAELRFPIFSSVGGTLFYDLSQVWRNASEIDLSLEGDTGLRQGVGLELRYMSPIGPIRVGYGLPIDRRRLRFNVIEVDNKGEKIRDLFQDPEGTKESEGGFYFSIGYPF